jgi:hypothetical protein
MHIIAHFYDLVKYGVILCKFTQASRFRKQIF